MHVQTHRCQQEPDSEEDGYAVYCFGNLERTGMLENHMPISSFLEHFLLQLVNSEIYGPISSLSTYIRTISTVPVTI